MSREEELKEQTNNELRELLEEYEQPTRGNKDELVSRILYFEAGVSEPDSEDEDDDEADNGEAAAEDADADDDAAGESVDADEEESESQDPEPPAEAAEADSNDLVLVKYTGRSPSFQRGAYTFSAQHPYIAVPSDVCSKLVEREPRRFRTATQAEVERYYS